MYMRKVGIWGEVRTVWRRATTYEQRMHVGASVLRLRVHGAQWSVVTLRTRPRSRRAILGDTFWSKA